MEGSSSAHPIYSPWSRWPEDVLEALEVFPEGGAVSSEAERRLKEYRFDRVRGAKSDGPRTIVADQYIARLWHVFDLRVPASTLLRKDRTQNLCLWTASGLCVGLLLAAVCLPGSTDVLLTAPPGPRDWAPVLGTSLVPLAILRVLKDTMGIGL